MRCYQNKMYNTLSGSVVVDAESERVQMLSICLATPLTPVTNTARVDMSHARPMCNDVVVLLYVSITAVKKNPSEIQQRDTDLLPRCI